MPFPFLLGKCGLLPLAAPALVFIAMRFGALIFPRGKGTASDRAVGGALSAISWVILGVRLFGLLHWLTLGALFGALAAVAMALAILGRDARFEFPWSQLASWKTAPLLLAALFALGAALLAADWLPIWQWDALGYHLPYVMFALQAHATSGVPDGAPYIATYPHAIELFMIALCALLPDDRLVDLAQIPFAILGAIATAGLARKAGAMRAIALGAAAAWLLVPAVFLQLPTDYVDIGAASLLLCALYFLIPRREALPSKSASSHACPVSPRAEMLLGVLALGLYAATKPNAPLAASLVSVALLVKYWRTNHFRWLVFALALAALFASETLVGTALHHGNPLWPARIDLGPLHLPGRNALSEILESGARAPRLHGPLALRLLQSWSSLTAPPICDMRFGGMGPLFLLALVPALLTMARLRNGFAWLALVAAVLAPDPSIARYVLALPALVFAFAAPQLDAFAARKKWNGAVASLAVAAIAAWQLAYAWPGLTGEGPKLFAYAAMNEAERLAAVGANGRPDALIELRKRVADGETFAFDTQFELPYLAWESNARYRVVFIPDGLREGDVADFLSRNRVRVASAADESAAGKFLAAHPGDFEKVSSSKSLRSSTYARR